MTAVQGRRPRFHIGFRTSVIALFVGVVLFVGLSLVYLSFNRVTNITRSAASSYLDTVAQLSADRIDAQLRTARDSLDILRGLASVQDAAIRDNRQLYMLLAAMLRTNKQLYSLYVGYDDGTFLEMDVIERAGLQGRERLHAPSGAAFRLVVISVPKEGATPVASTTFLTDALTPLLQRPGPSDYDPRTRPWFKDAYEPGAALVIDPYVFFATKEPGYTLRLPIAEGRRGVVAADALLGVVEDMLRKQQLGRSGIAFLFDDAGRVLAHPDMSHFLHSSSDDDNELDELPRLDAVDTIGLTPAIAAWRRTGETVQFFDSRSGRTYVAAFRPVETASSANLRLGVFAPLDEFYQKVEAERRALITAAIGFVLATIPLAFFVGSMLSRSLMSLARETDSIQHFKFTETPRLRSPIREIDELGRSVFTMRTLIKTFASFVPKHLVQQLVQSGSEMTLGGNRREVSVLFSDIADFTSLTENAAPDQVMLYTSRYFTALSEAVMKSRGTVDKFIGDAVMAIWNAPIEDEHHVVNVCSAVLACIKASDALNAEFEREGWPAYRTRFGLHVGDAVVGNIGSPDRMNYTALGTTVNLAARLEALNKNYGTTVLVSEAVRDAAQSSFVFRSVDRIRPKGFATEFQIFELVGSRDDRTIDFSAIDAWEEIYPSLWHDTPARFPGLQKYLAAYPWDSVAAYHAQRARSTDVQQD